jgi:integrase
MATVQFKALGKKSPVNLNLRFFHNTINCYAKSNIFIDLNNWSEDKNTVKRNSPQDIKDRILPLMEGLTNYVLNSFSTDFPIGETIDTGWLIKQVNGFYSKPDNENDYRYYFVPFVRKYIEESKTRVNPNSGKIISPLTIRNYNTTLKRMEEFEEIHGKLRTKNINLNFHKQFTSFCKTVGKYSGTLIEKYVSQIKHFVKEAKMEGYETSVEIESRKFTFKREATFDIYLNRVEVQNIFDLDLQNNPRLNNARDLMIAGLWTGLRISDLQNFNNFLITGNRIKILETEKTGEAVVIPIHPQLQYVLDKRNNKLPELSSQNFNAYMKEVCKLAKITEMTLGTKKDPKTKRNVKGHYSKYKLVSSHTLRRSFVTNLVDLNASAETIMALSSHRSYREFAKYIKTTKEETANKVEKIWQEEDGNNLKVV